MKIMTNTLILAYFPGFQEMILILIIILLLFGGKKIPELMKGMGKGIRNFKEGIKSDEDDEEKDNPKSDNNKKKES